MSQPPSGVRSADEFVNEGVLRAHDDVDVVGDPLPARQYGVRVRTRYLTVRSPVTVQHGA
ncbi:MULTISPECIES: hypothetical protein [Nocardiaceae]|uniref:Uncharacterized protein n=1 Tax=Rhodococcoides corynebacterioides TaxID=53972 RepID=A0ABS2KUM0_9NOCA|nr:MULTISPECIES: hypothetical protein [Rhodococcus]MBM7415506.1 hypothetical protein [Rhodococcus corynebacterioides]MBP1117968.1 hypothetical protein [Rhodococcus sp. PvP016]